MHALRIAISFLTTLALRPDGEIRRGDLGRAAAWFPTVGLLIGVLTAAALTLFHFLFAPLLCAALTIAVWVFLTGALHLDGLADCCDALFVSAPPQRRLEILRDPRRGAFGLTGLVLFLILKTAALASLIETEGNGLWFASLANAITAILLATVFARWMVLFAARQPLARQDGLGADLAMQLTPRSLLLAGLLPVLWIAVTGVRGVIAAAAAALLVLIIVRFARTQLGGVTGDVFGLLIELVELTVLLVFCARF